MVLLQPRSGCMPSRPSFLGLVWRFVLYTVIVPLDSTVLNILIAITALISIVTTALLSYCQLIFPFRVTTPQHPEEAFPSPLAPSSERDLHVKHTGPDIGQLHLLTRGGPVPGGGSLDGLPHHQEFKKCIPRWYFRP